MTLGYTAVLIAAATFYFDYKLGWDETKLYTFWAVLLYFFLNSTLTIWIWGVEKGKIYNGSKDDVLVSLTIKCCSHIDKIQISIISSVTKHSPTYKLKIRSSGPAKSNAFDWKETEIEAPFTRWFTADGEFVAKPFQQWLAAEIPIVGQAVESKGS